VVITVSLPAAGRPAIVPAVFVNPKGAHLIIEKVPT